MKYSQNNEEGIILEHFSVRAASPGGLIRVRRFLDIGAYDGKTFSNTRALFELGMWTGVLFEPSPTVLPALQEVYKDETRAIVMPFAVVPDQTLRGQCVTWFDSNGDAVSTTSEVHKTKWERGARVNYRRFKIPVMPVDELFEIFGYYFNFVNIDVEGCNLDLFKVFPWEVMGDTSCICVEHDGNQKEMFERLEPLGFSIATENAENLIFVR